MGDMREWIVSGQAFAARVIEIDEIPYVTDPPRDLAAKEAMAHAEAKAAQEILTAYKGVRWVAGPFVAAGTLRVKGAIQTEPQERYISARVYAGTPGEAIASVQYVVRWITAPMAIEATQAYPDERMIA